MSKTPLDPESRPLTAAPLSGGVKVSKTPVAPGSIPSSRNDELPLPHERDESSLSVAEAPNPVIEQAKRDTDMRATPGQNADLRKRLVPGPGGQPPSIEPAQDSPNKSP